MRSLILLTAILAIISGCSPERQQMIDEEKAANANPAQTYIDNAILVHGGDRFLGRTVEFDFRKIHYSVARTEDKFIYTRSFQSDSLGSVQDTLVNSSSFTRHRDGQLEELSDNWQGRLGNSVNSVLYFTQLPFGLNDPAVVKKYLGEATIESQRYHKIQVTFKKEGGGDDFDDIYMYWIHMDEFTLDYLGYEFSVDGGGSRFRKAIDRQVIDGIVFQNYINYKAEDKDTPIGKHDELFDKGQLIELSRIINTDITVVPN
ncbi:MAG: DUF6503 family protein [Cyclobacteriaceae bacterium]